MTSSRHASPPSEHELEGVLRSLSPDDELLTPPAEIWSRIESTLVAAAPVVALAPRRRLRTLAPYLAAAAAVVVAVVGVGLWAQGGGVVVEVARADLSHDPEAFDPLGAEASARAAVVDDGGGLSLHLDDTVLPATATADADLEVWLIVPDADGGVADLVSLGTVDPGSPEDLPIPPAVDPAVYSVVDISIEPRDGDPAHSGRSILRGPLTPT